MKECVQFRVDAAAFEICHFQASPLKDQVEFLPAVTSLEFAYRHTLSERKNDWGLLVLEMWMVRVIQVVNQTPACF